MTEEQVRALKACVADALASLAGHVPPIVGYACLADVRKGTSGEPADTSVRSCTLVLEYADRRRLTDAQALEYDERIRRHIVDVAATAGCAIRPECILFASPCA